MYMTIIIFTASIGRRFSRCSGSNNSLKHKKRQSGNHFTKLNLVLRGWVLSCTTDCIMYTLCICCKTYLYESKLSTVRGREVQEHVDGSEMDPRDVYAILMGRQKQCNDGLSALIDVQRLMFVWQAPKADL